MASLTEVYEGGAGGADLRRLYVGVGLFVVGVAVTVAGIVVGTSTTAATAIGLSVPYGAREVAGVLAGVGLPVTFLGAITVLPRANWRLRAAAGLGVGIALTGVVAFTAVYPENWYGMTPDYALPVTFVYFLGALTTLWSLFVAVANFKARNDPGGTVRLEITREGTTKVVEVSNDRLRQGLGGIGLLGSTPDGEVETQTNDPTATRSDGGATREASLSTPGGESNRQRRPAAAAPPAAGSGASEPEAAHPAAGGATPDPTTTTDAEVIDEPSSPSGDPYCGNCTHFRYVRTDDGLAAYCGLHEDLMDDMDPCSRWQP